MNIRLSVNRTVDTPFIPLSLLLSRSPSQQFMCLIKPFIPPRTFFPSERPSSEITHSTHNGVCSYRLSTERPGTHICSRIPQTINNSLPMFKSNFSDKVLTIKKKEIVRRLSHSGDLEKSFSPSFSAASRFL